MKKPKKRVNSKGQTTVELLVLLAVSMLALTIIYSLYSDQLILIQGSKDSSTAKSTVQKMVDAANTAYLSGKDSELKIFIEVPDSIDLTNSQIIGKSVILQLGNGTDIIGSADVNMVGNFRTNTGKYTMYLHYDGNVVRIGYRDFEFNKQSVFVSVTQGSDSLQTFTIRNNSDSQIEFWIDSNFSHSLVTLNIMSDDTSFSLNNGDIRTVDFNFETDVTAYGNYAGTINVIGQQNDVNTVKNMYVSVESYLQVSDLMIYPRTTTITTTASAEETQDYSICNHSSSNITSITWTRQGTAAGWFSDPSITNVNALECEAFTSTFSIGSAGTYDANLTATYTDNNTYTTFMTFNVT
ncbi:MAG: hypothetical protein HON47_01030 [Candidatus Diapherotrites archaeon]|jgi:hypothetical protein|uniref:Uncharacterized protein n=1 Tax=Candidatus Iainarchaeum sp. TaxID=3101447 RepID=A0A8T5GDV5_9ARCH|nr:hypothetical protein [Candidatus Diapherotrites archaeon]